MPLFGDLEAAIMARVWAADDAVSVRDVLESLRQDRQIAYTTVQTVMEILFRKGWLARRKEGRAFRYWATASREEYAADLIDEALTDAPSRAAVLARFVERMDPSEVAELRAELANARRREGRR